MHFFHSHMQLNFLIKPLDFGFLFLANRSTNVLSPFLHYITIQHSQVAPHVVLMVKNWPASAGDTRDMGSIPGLGRSPGVANGNPLLSSCLGNFMDRGVWWAIVHGAAKIWIILSTYMYIHTYIKHSLQFTCFSSLLNSPATPQCFFLRGRGEVARGLLCLLP